MARNQVRGGFGGMVCFELRDGLESGVRPMNLVRLVRLSVGLEDAEDLMSDLDQGLH